MDLAIVQLIQGQNLPLVGQLHFKVRWGKELAKLEPIYFDSESAITIIEQEAAFQTSKHDIRLISREPIRLECMYQAPNSAKYCIHDAMLNFDQHLPFRSMYKLENVPKEYFPGGPPLLQINTFFEWNQAKRETTEVIKHMQPIADKISAPPSLVPTSSLKPKLINNEYFLIGNSSEVHDMYSLSITISFAENLLDLFPEQKYWPPSHASCHFSFSLLGQTIAFRPFNQLRYQVDVGEKATARIKCSPENLLMFLEHSMPSLSILFCCEDIPLGEVLVPIWERIKRQGKDNHILHRLHIEPVIFPGLFEIRSLLQFEHTNHQIHSTSFKPQMGVVFLLSQIPSEVLNQSAIDTSIVEPQTHIHGSTSPLVNSATFTRPAASLEDMMYATALELEVWKEEQKLLEREKQERAQVEYMELLNSEYRHQVSMKEAAFERRVKMIHDLERQLESTIAAVQKCEKEVQQQKLALDRRENQFVRDQRQNSVNVESATQMLEKKHKFEMDAMKKRHSDIVSELRRQQKEERARIAELESRQKVYRKRIAELEENLRQTTEK